MDEFLDELPNFDADIEAKRKEADASGEVSSVLRHTYFQIQHLSISGLWTELVHYSAQVLRFVGIVDVEANEGSVKLLRLPKSDPFAQLSGTDNIIAFTTSRYSKNQRLIVRGPGAGAEVTAAGVFSDLLRLASYLGAPS